MIWNNAKTFDNSESLKGRKIRQDNEIGKKCLTLGRSRAMLFDDVERLLKSDR